MPILGPILIGAAIGAGVAEATGGKWEKGAIFGAIGGGIGGMLNPYSIGGASMLVSASTVGGAVGGATGGYAAGLIGKAMRIPETIAPRATKAPSPLPRISAEIKSGKEALSARLKRARSRISSRVMLPGQLSELPNIQRPELSDVFG